MIGIPILSQIKRFQVFCKACLPLRRVNRSDLHTAWLEPTALPDRICKSPVARRYLSLLGPLAWDRLPERNLQRNWGQVTIPYASFIAAYLVKLNEGKDSMADLRLFLIENPALIWLFGFPELVSNPGRRRSCISTDLPTARHLTHMLRVLPTTVLQFLLADSVGLIRQELAAVGVHTGECISLDTKHILAWVRENNLKAYVENRYDKTKQPAGDPDCKLGCKRRHNRRKAGSEPETPVTPTKNPIPVKGKSSGEFFWGYGSGVVVIKAPGWGEFVLAEMTQTFDRADTTYFFPLMAQVEERLGFRPSCGTFDCAFDAWYTYEYFHRPDNPACFAAVPFGEKGGYKAKSRQFSPEGLPKCEAGLPMPLKMTFIDRTRAIIEHERGKYACPLLFPEPNGDEVCSRNHKNWPKGGCTVDMPLSIGARLRYTLDRDGEAYRNAYKQRTAVERINSQAKALGIERPYLRNRTAIANQNTLIYLLINLRLLQRIRTRQKETN